MLMLVKRRRKDVSDVIEYVKNFYCQFRVNGKLHMVRLHTQVKGVPPASGNPKDDGDDAFNASREAAKTEMDDLIKQYRNGGDRRAVILKTFKELTGEEWGNPFSNDTENAALFGVKKEDEIKATFRSLTGETWELINPSIRDLGRLIIERKIRCKKDTDWSQYTASIFDKFADFAEARGIKTVLGVKNDLAKAYANHLVETYSRETAAKHIHRITNTFNRYTPKGDSNPFEGVMAEVLNELHELKGNSTIARKPLSNVELATLFEIARKHSEAMYNITVCAACTGLRLKDVCLLKWENVDLDTLTLNVITSKTGAEVQVPIILELKDMIACAHTAALESGSEYVFPEIAARYLENPTGVAYAGKELFAATLQALDAKADIVEVDGEEMTPAERKEKILAAIDGAKWSEEKRNRIRANAIRILDGGSYGDITRETGWPKNRISMDFAEVEKIAGISFRPHKGTKMRKRELIDKYTRAGRKSGLRQGSLYGWHSLRHTFVVRALSAGVPAETVRNIVGHTTVDQTREYYNPTKKIIAEQMRAKLDPESAKGTISADDTRLLSQFTPEQLSAYLLQLSATKPEAQSTMKALPQ